MRSRFDEVGGGGFGEADAIPENPLAENAATEALKPKPKPVPAVGASLDDPNAPALPGVEASSSAPKVNMDPNAYAPPPQATPDSVPPADAAPAATPNLLASNVTPFTMPGQSPEQAPMPGISAPAPIPTLSGDWTPPTASAESAPLIASAAGGTMTPQGDVANSFRGYQTSQGGGFGGYMAEKGADAPLWSAVSNGDPKAIQQALSSADPALQQAAADAVSRMLTMNDTQAGGIQMLKNLSPEARAMVQKTFTTGNGGYAADQAGYDKNRPNQSALYQQSWDRFSKDIDTAPAGLPVGRNAGNYTAKDPAEQQRLLAGQAAGTVPSGPATRAPVLRGNADQASFDPGGVNASPGNIITEPTQQFTAAPAPAPPAPALPAPAPSGQPQAQAPEGVVPTPQKVQSTPVQPTAPQLPATAPSGAPQPTASGMGNVARTGVTPENALTNDMIARNEGADRFKIAQDQWDAFTKSTAPQYEADQRSAMRRAAAGGALGSGMLQTSLGDLASNRALAMDTQKQNFLSEALKGNIDDQFRDVGVAQQQQGFQKSQQEQAFGNEVTRESLQEALTNGSFQRALQQLTAGSSGNPADTALLLSQIFGGQASEAGSSLAALLGGLGQRNAGGAPTGGGTTSAPSDGIDWGSLLSSIFKTKNLGGSLPTGQAIGGGTGPTSPFAVGY